MTDRDAPASARVVGRGYRSTKPIMRFANQLLPAEGRRIESLQGDGPPVDVVSATAKNLGEKVIAQAVRLCDAYPKGTVAVFTGFPGGLLRIPTWALLAGCVVLAPAIIGLYTVKAAERDDRERGL